MSDAAQFLAVGFLGVSVIILAFAKAYEIIHRDDK